MAIVLNNITSGYNLSKINANFQNIEDYINDKLLARADTGVAGEAMMERDLDMNGHSILNVETGTEPGSIATKGYVDALNNKTLRFQDNIPAATYGAGVRANSLQGYDSAGKPVPLFTTTGTADLAVKLASHTQGLGSGLVGTYPAGTVENALYFITPEMYGAVGDGVTDDILALEQANAAAISLGKRLSLGAKTYGISRAWSLPSYSRVFGVENVSKIVALGSWNGPVVMSQNAPAGDYLTVDNASAMVLGIEIEGLIIESGWTGTSADTRTHTEALRIYGAGTKLKAIRAGYCRGVGANLGGRGQTSIRYAAPSLYEDIRIDMVGEHGIVIGGSSDNHSSKIIVRNSGLLSHNTYDGIRFGGGGGTRGDQFHVWQSGDSALTPLYQNRVRHGLYLASFDSFISNCHFEGSATSQVCFVGARNSVINTRCYSNWESGGSAVLFLADANTFEGFVGAPMNSTPATGVHAFTIGSSTGSPIKNYRIDAYVFGCKFINYLNASGRGHVRLRGDLSVSGTSGIGTIVTGTAPETDFTEINSPQYTGTRLGMNLISTDSFGISSTDISASGNLSAGGLVTLTGLSLTIPTVTGRLYMDSNGFVKVKT